MEGIAFPGVANAYIGPETSSGAVAITLALLFGLLMLFFGLFWYPLKRQLRQRRADTRENSPSQVE